MRLMILLYAIGRSFLREQFPEAIWRTHYQIIWFFEDQSDKDKLIIKLNLGKESIQKSQKWTEHYPL